ncbi:MAG: hypothetical protein AB7S26_24175 [Sandaracinaceae bacterium]
MSRAVLLAPDRIDQALGRVRERDVVPVTPNRWQITLGVLRMWHRMIFRSDTVGTSFTDPVRPNLRARLLSQRALRAPFLLAERAIAPLDFSGLLSGPDRIIRHLLGAHHDGAQFVYDFALLDLHDGKMEELLRRAHAVVDGDDPRGEWLRDLVVYEGYHERLVDAAERHLRGELVLSNEDARDPDIAFAAYLRWCARQPQTLDATLEAWRDGRFTIADGVDAVVVEPVRPAASRTAPATPL